MKQSYNGVPVPQEGRAITFADRKFVVPDDPVIPYIEGDGTGRDIWKASERVFDAAVPLWANSSSKEVDMTAAMAGSEDAGAMCGRTRACSGAI